MSTKPESEFFFFRPDKRQLPGDGRDPRVPLQTDPVINETSTDVHLAILLAGITFVIYLASMSWQPFPGPSSNALLRCLDPLQPPATQKGVLSPRNSAAVTPDNRRAWISRRKEKWPGSLRKT